MKKTVCKILAPLCTVITLSSCKVNWFDQQYDVPWWMIAVPIILFLAIVWLVAGKCIASKKYVCPKCNRSFHPKWWIAAISIHINTSRLFKCPHCGQKGFCTRSRETED